MVLDGVQWNICQHLFLLVTTCILYFDLLEGHNLVFRQHIIVAPNCVTTIFKLLFHVIPEAVYFLRDYHVHKNILDAFCP